VGLNTGIDKDCYTYSRKAVELKVPATLQQVEEAFKWEKQLKNGAGRRNRRCLKRVGIRLIV
jgi:predicted GIY-YIG superfamily endonuclease